MPQPPQSSSHNSGLSRRNLAANSTQSLAALLFAGSGTIIPMMVLAMAFVAVTLPAMTVLILLLTSNRSLMEEHVNSKLTSAALGLIILLSLFVAWETAQEFLQNLNRIF